MMSSALVQRGEADDVPVVFTRSSDTVKAHIRGELLLMFWSHDSRDDFDADEIIPGLWLGSVRAAMATNGLNAANVRHVLTVARNMIQFTPTQTLKQSPSINVVVEGEHGVVEIDDTPQQCLLAAMAPALQFVDECLSRKDGNVLVHCAAGVSRSASVVIAYLMTRKAMTYQQALQHVTAARSIVYPNTGFIAQLQLLERFEGDSEKALEAYRSGAFSRRAT